MVSRVFRNKAKRVYWQTHIEAWQRSGLSRKAYCDAHRLWPGAFRRWLKMFEEDAGQKLERAEKRRKKRARTLSAGKRSKAVQAFWAMHVEAWQWSGLNASAYAKVHHLTRQTLLKWRDRLEAEPEGIDWRELVHPSARPRTNGGRLSIAAKTGAKDRPVETVLTDNPSHDPLRDGRSNRRSFTTEEKRAIVMEAEAPDVSVAAVARHHEIATSMIFRWRTQFGLGRGKLAQLAAVRVAEERPGRKHGTRPEAVVLSDLLPMPNGMAAVDLPDGRRVFAPAGSDPEAVRRTVAEREARS
jgi:transposase-like protein